MSNAFAETPAQAAAWDAVLADSLDLMDALEEAGRSYLAQTACSDDATW